MSDVFLNYNKEDRTKAKMIAEALEQHTYSVWWDRKIPAGKVFDEYIQEKLNEAKCVIVLWSNDSVKSPWVKDEAIRGNRRGILVPILIDNVEIPLGFGLIQAIQLIDWNGELPHQEFDLLLESIAGILGQSPAAKIEDKKKALKETKTKTQEEEKRLELKKEEERKTTLAWNIKGYDLNNLGKYKEAITAYDKALEIDPQYKLALDNKAKVLNLVK